MPDDDLTYAYRQGADHEKRKASDDFAALAETVLLRSEQMSLADKMRTLADTGHVRADDLRRLADQLDAADARDPRNLLGRWARARRCWSECSGEPLI